MGLKKKASRKTYRRDKTFTVGDLKAYQFLVNIFEKYGFYPITQGRYYNLANLDGYLWDVADRAVTPDPYAGTEFTANDLVHQTFHVAAATRFGWEYSGRPKICLLIEAIAYCSQLYFEAAFLAKTGDFEKSSVVNIFVRNSQILKRPFLKSFNEGIGDPFQFYKNLIQDQLKISFIFLDYFKSVQQGPRIPPEKIRQQVSKVKGLVFLNQVAFGAFVSYTVAFCGAESNKQDIRDFDKCMDILNSSKNMVEFLQALHKEKAAAVADAA